MHNVTKLREKMEMTQEEFADFCGISRTSIARYEAGGKISRSSAVKIAEACRVTVDYVLGIEQRAPMDDEDPADDVWELREQLRRDPDMRVLFSAARTASPDHIRAAAAMLKALKETENAD